MKILPISADSLGVRSMCIFVKTNDVNILIDPGAALGPKRYGLPPHPLEVKALDDSLKKIRKFMRKSDILIITHYHYDHYIPDESELYEGKFLLIKHPKENINHSQRIRSKNFLDVIDDLPKKVEYGDGREFRFGATKLKFSPAVWHGPVNSKVGKVIMVSINDGDQKFVYGSDAQGLLDKEALEWVVNENPDIAVIDGPPTIFIGWRMKATILTDSIKNINLVLQKTKVKTILLEHHVVRDVNYKQKMRDVFEIAEKVGKKVLNYAEYLGTKPLYLEAWRKELYQGTKP